MLGLTSADESIHKRSLAMLERARQARRPYDSEAWLNIAFFLGGVGQYSEWNDASQSIRVIPRKAANPETGQMDETDLPRPVLNKIQHYIYTAHAETLQDKPSADVLPATDDYAALIDQDVNKAYLNYVMEPVNANWDLQLSIATLWALITPSGWLKWVWDPELKRPDMLPVPFFDLAIDPYARQFARARWAIHTQFMDREAAEDAFQVKINKNEIGKQDEFKVELLRGMGCAPLTEGVAVHELWHRPTRRNPDGMYVAFTDRRNLKVGKGLPYEHLRKDAGMLPFTQLGSLLRPDSLYYTAPVTALRPAQMVWNKFVAQAILMQENYAAPKWWVAEELQMKHMPNSSPHQILRGHAGNTGLKPELIQPPSIPDSSRILEIFEKQMMHVVSVHEVSQGQVPGRVEAAKAIELLQTSDKGRYKHLHDTIDQTISIGWWQLLMLGRQYDTPNKMVMTYSREGIPLVKHWRKGAVDPGCRIRVVRMGGLGRTRAERQDTLLLYWEKGLITDPDVMAEMLDVPIPSFTNARANDMRMARSENEIMAGGQAVVPGSWENHAIHIREHNEYRKTFEFHALAAGAKSRFEMHVQRHKSLQIQATLEQAKLMMAAQGIAPGMPPPEGAGPGGPGTEAAPEPAGAAPMQEQVPPQPPPAQGVA